MKKRVELMMKQDRQLHFKYLSIIKYLIIYIKKWQRSSSIAFDCHALLGYPMYLGVALLVTSAVLGVFVQSTMIMTQEADDHLVLQELQRLVVEAENMYEYADQGSRVTLHLHLPSSFYFAVFGDNPRSDWSYPASLDRSHSMTSNQWYYVMNSGQSSVFHSSVRFCGTTDETIAILGPGELTVVLELKHHEEGISYVHITIQ